MFNYLEKKCGKLAMNYQQANRRTVERLSTQMDIHGRRICQAACEFAGILKGQCVNSRAQQVVGGHKAKPRRIANRAVVQEAIPRLAARLITRMVILCEREWHLCV